MRVSLNVGGKRYDTTEATLLSVSNSFFSAMFSGNFALSPDADGSYFIDRDGYLFRQVLNYLREPDKFVVPESRTDRRRLLNEAHYFQLSHLAELLSFSYADLSAAISTGLVASFPSYLALSDADARGQKAVVISSCVNGAVTARLFKAPVAPLKLTSREGVDARGGPVVIFHTTGLSEMFQIEGFLSQCLGTYDVTLLTLFRKPIVLTMELSERAAIRCNTVRFSLISETPKTMQYDGSATVTVKGINGTHSLDRSIRRKSILTTPRQVDLGRVSLRMGKHTVEVDCYSDCFVEAIVVSFEASFAFAVLDVDVSGTIRLEEI
jgi:hypothetical protein